VLHEAPVHGGAALSKSQSVQGPAVTVSVQP